METLKETAIMNYSDLQDASELLKSIQRNAQACDTFIIEQKGTKTELITKLSEMVESFSKLSMQLERNLLAA